MGSRLWNVKVLQLDNDRVRLWVGMAHPDAGPFPVSKQFALRLLFDEAQSMTSSMQSVPRGPLGEALTLGQALSDRFMRDGAARFISAVDVSNVENVPFDEQAVNRKVEDQVRATGLQKEQPEWDDAFDQRWRAFWKETSNLPSAVYDIVVTEPRWLDHLRSVKEWGSTAYCGDGPFLGE